MSDDPLSSIPKFDRVSIRAILAAEGEDPSQALFEAGIYDPVAVPVVFGDATPDMYFGDGFTSNLTGVLETDAPEEAEATPGAPTAPAQHAGPVQTEPREGAGTIVLPPAFGLQPLAPVRRSGSAR